MPKTSLAVKKVQITSLSTRLIGSKTHTSVDRKVSALMSELGEARKAIEQKSKEIGGAAGLPVGDVEYGVGDGFYRRYQHGIIYFLPPSGPCWVHGAILAKYRALGADASLLGYPTTDELATPDGAGRYTHFERGSIYWTYGTGAHEVHGAIREKWAALGWEKSWLGYPKSDELESTEKGYVSVFEKGSIYWWPDTGAIDIGDIAVRYKGLYCFGDTRAPGDDEPYVIFGVVPTPGAQPSAVRTRIYDGDDSVDAGDSRPDHLELYRGFPGTVAIGIFLWENDHGNPDHYLGLVKQGADLAGKGIGQACGALFGPEAGPACEGIWKAVAPEIVGAVNGLLGTGDDLLGTSTWNPTVKYMVTRAGGACDNHWGIQYQVQSELLSDGDASYKVYFDIVRV